MSTDPLSSVIVSLEREKIIPDVIPEAFSPSVLFTVIYPTGKEGLLGSELTREEAFDEPEINFMPMQNNIGTEGEPTYTLVMTDPDAPSRAEPKFRQFRHWVITGIKSPIESASETTNLTAFKTKTSTTPYRPPGPPPGTGLHRYTFLLFEEPAGFSVPQGAVEYGAEMTQRRSWNAIEFGKKYGLKLVGASYFLVRSTE
ncbi:PEBP-like protein [Guyanagaster necrorhizus]|uniref:PEBP-like protein n=1 Tax=Guyanagaster necrorhizus TaxID=856835 RepID=A0A9P7VGC3_9AGAR|nr:PEBP-like protein [Guyanagaster necrorhizus MCA 3950]KAG7440057.1 PEBP-like protein [Guyanagaster necrorhizus MCA 3950]